mgnify:CR=1 FL=1|jgi:hypothetical protein
MGEGGLPASLVVIIVTITVLIFAFFGLITLLVLRV